MIKISNRLYSFVALLFVFLTILGYQLATTLLLPLSSDIEGVSHAITYPYRAIVFVLAVFLILTTPKNKTYYSYKKPSFSIVFVVFMIAYFIRILIDIYIRDVYVLPTYKTDVVLTLFVAMIPSLWATIRCAEYLDFNKLNKWLLFGGVLLLLITIISQNSLIAIDYDEMSRLSGNVALGSLSLGYTSVTLFCIFLSMRKFNQRNTQKTILLVLMFLSFVVMLRAASRGPLVSFVVIVLFFVFSKIKKKTIGIGILIILLVVMWMNITDIVHVLGGISPMMEQRMVEAMVENDSSGRDLLTKNAIEIFTRNPIIGSQFVLDNGFYSHNSVLDVMIGLGFFGALIWLILIVQSFKVMYRYVQANSELMIVSILSVQMILKNMFSGAFYMSNVQVVCMGLVFATINKISQEKSLRN